MVAAVSYRKRDENFFFYFFWDERDIVELELGAVKLYGFYKSVYRYQGVVVEPGFVVY